MKICIEANFFFQRHEVYNNSDLRQVSRISLTLFNQGVGHAGNKSVNCCCLPNNCRHGEQQTKRIWTNIDKVDWSILYAPTLCLEQLHLERSTHPAVKDVASVCECVCVRLACTYDCGRFSSPTCLQQPCIPWLSQHSLDWCFVPVSKHLNLPTKHVETDTTK